MVYNSPTAASCGFACGLMSGLGQSAMFNSYDRAMYYSIVNRRPFLNAENWKGNPFTGISPSFLQRSFSAGLYFPLEDVFRYHVSSSHAIDGVLVGLVGGFLTTPFNTVKYAMWSHNSSIGKSTQPGLIATANALLRDGGFPRLMRGVVPTLYRDMTFGLTFSLLRHQGDNGFGINAGAAFLGTVLSSPFNYARMRIYGHSSGPRRVGPILREWVAEVVAHGSMVDRIKFACSSLNVGWGALRSMAYCEPNSAFRNIPIYHLEDAIIKSVPLMTRKGKISLEDDPDRIADKMVKDPQIDEFCWSLYFDAPFLIRLFYAGFLPICSNIGAVGDPIYVLLPKLHFSRCIVDLSGQRRKKIRNVSKYTLTVNSQFENVVQGCLEQHSLDRCWLYPPLRSSLAELNRGEKPIVHSIELTKDGKLVAGEIGYTVGSIYTSMTGFYRESGAGSIQLMLLEGLLRKQGFEIWDLGMEMEYKRNQLGANLMSRKNFMSLCIVLDMDIRWWTEPRFEMVINAIKFFVSTIGLSQREDLCLSVIACFHDRAVPVLVSKNWRDISSLSDKLSKLRAEHIPKEEVYEIPIAQGISKALCFGNIDNTVNSVIVFECISDFVAQTVALSNCGWAAGETHVHVVSLGGVGKVPSPGLMSLCNKTGGVYIPPQFTQSIGELTQALLFHLGDTKSGLFKTRPALSETHMAATCVCHNKQCTMGYVCSICLAVYCSETAGTCAMCGSRMRREAKDEQPISGQPFSKLFRK